MKESRAPVSNGILDKKAIHIFPRICFKNVKCGAY